MPFRSLPVTLSRTELANSAFYRAFYAALTDHVPPEYVALKRGRADWLHTQWPPHQRVLSLGASIGALEQRLAELGHQVIASEPILPSTMLQHANLSWHEGYFPESFADRPPVDILLISHVLSAMPNASAERLLRACAAYPARAIWVLCFADPSWPRSLIRAWNMRRHMRPTLANWQFHAFGRTRHELERLIRRAGLTIARAEYALRTREEEEYLVVCGDQRLQPFSAPDR